MGGSSSLGYKGEQRERSTLACLWQSVQLLLVIYLTLQAAYTLYVITKHCATASASSSIFQAFVDQRLLPTEKVV
jgi:hypothetical protein